MFCGGAVSSDRWRHGAIWTPFSDWLGRKWGQSGKSPGLEMPFSIKKFLRAEHCRTLPIAESSNSKTFQPTPSSLGTYLTRIQVATSHQPTYIPNLSPADFILFPMLKRSLKGHLSKIFLPCNSPKEVTVDDFQETLQRGNRVGMYIDTERHYFEEF